VSIHPSIPAGDSVFDSAIDHIVVLVTFSQKLTGKDVEIYNKLLLITRNRRNSLFWWLSLSQYTVRINISPCRW